MEDATPVEQSTPPDSLDPSAFKYRGVEGEPFRAMGGEWLLARPGLSPDLDGLRDRLFDDMTLTGKVVSQDIYEAAFILLKLNYQVTSEQAGDVLMAAEKVALCQAVLAAFFGPVKLERNYSEWARASLRINGLDPLAVSARELPHILNLLTLTGRTAGASKYVESAEAVDRRTQMA